MGEAKYCTNSPPGRGDAWGHFSVQGFIGLGITAPCFTGDVLLCFTGYKSVVVARSFSGVWGLCGKVLVAEGFRGAL